MSLLLQVLFWLYVAGMVALFIAVYRAPKGYEDSKGFHKGNEGERKETHPEKLPVEDAEHLD